MGCRCRAPLHCTRASDILIMMFEPLKGFREALADLCTRFEVRRLELFGSAARGTFHPETSDFDFLVLFRQDGILPADDRYFGLLAGLEDLFKRKIDLVDVCAARNPYFIAGALKQRVPVYAA